MKNLNVKSKMRFLRSLRKRSLKSGKTGKEVSEIEFIPVETMNGLDGYEVKIKLI